MRSILRHALTCAAYLVPGMAMAEQSILMRPESCTPVMTIQKHGCEVETQLRCGAGETTFWRYEASDMDGFSGVTHADQHHSLIEYQSSDGDFRVYTDPARTYADAPLSMMTNGAGDMAQIGTMSVWGAKKPFSMTATLKLEPEGLQLNGRNLQRFSAIYEITLPPPVPLIHGTGIVYFDKPTGVLFEGEQVMDWPSSEGEIPHSPAALILPGEPGFDRPHPTYDCGDLSLNQSDEKAYQA